MVRINKVVTLYHKLISFASGALCKLYVTDIEVFSGNKGISKDEKTTYSVMGFTILAFCLAMFISFTYATYLVLNQLVFSIVFGLFWTFLGLNLYRLILTTISGTILPHIAKTGIPVIPTILRIFFLSLLAFLIIKPIELLLHEDKIGDYIVIYKEESFEKHNDSLDSLYANLIAELDNLATNELAKQKQISIYKNDRIEQLVYYRLSLNKSAFPVQKLKILHSNFPETWVITLIFIAIFLFPFCFKLFYIIKLDYEIQLEYSELDITQSEYENFKKQYNQIFRNSNYGEVSYHESYVDAPFNTTKKVDPNEYKDRDALIKWIKQKSGIDE